MSKRRKAKRQAAAWAEIAYHYQEIAQWRGEALKRVWVVANTIDDEVLAETLRMAMVGDFILGDDEGLIEQDYDGLVPDERDED